MICVPSTAIHRIGAGGYGPERAARARQEDRQMPSHGQLQVDQRLDSLAVEPGRKLPKRFSSAR